MKIIISEMLVENGSTYLTTANEVSEALAELISAQPHLERIIFVTPGVFQPYLIFLSDNKVYRPVDVKLKSLYTEELQIVSAIAGG